MGACMTIQKLSWQYGWNWMWMGFASAREGRLRLAGVYVLLSVPYILYFVGEPKWLGATVGAILSPYLFYGFLMVGQDWIANKRVSLKVAFGGFQNWRRFGNLVVFVLIWFGTASIWQKLIERFGPADNFLSRVVMDQWRPEDGMALSRAIVILYIGAVVHLWMEFVLMLRLIDEKSWMHSCQGAFKASLKNFLPITLFLFLLGMGYLLGLSLIAAFFVVPYLVMGMEALLLPKWLPWLAAIPIAIPVVVFVLAPVVSLAPYIRYRTIFTKKPISPWHNSK